MSCAHAFSRRPSSALAERKPVFLRTQLSRLRTAGGDNAAVPPPHHPRPPQPLGGGLPGIAPSGLGPISIPRPCAACAGSDALRRWRPCSRPARRHRRSGHQDFLRRRRRPSQAARPAPAADPRCRIRNVFLAGRSSRRGGGRGGRRRRENGRLCAPRGAHGCVRAAVAGGAGVSGVGGDPRKAPRVGTALSGALRPRALQLHAPRPSRSSLPAAACPPRNVFSACVLTGCLPPFSLYPLTWRVTGAGVPDLHHPQVPR